MRFLRAIGLLLAAVAIVSAGIAVSQKDRLTRLVAVNTLFDEDRIVSNFSGMRALFDSAPIPVDSTAEPLPQGEALALPADWQDWLDRRAVTAVVVLHGGTIVHESYHLGTTREDQRISWSVAKSYLSGLIGVLHARGDVENLDALVTDAVPALAGSAYEGVTIRNVLQMSSGVDFDEDYLDFWSDINKMGRILALGGSMDGFAAGLMNRFAPPGTQWQYVSIDTHVLAMVAREATGQSLSALMGAHILGPMGTYGDPYYVTDGYGVAFALGGLNLTTRDYARMGEMFRQNGRFQGKQIVPADWVAECTAASAKTRPGAIEYGYQWWIPIGAREGEFLARGVYGQYVFIDRQSATVVAINGADRAFRAPGAFDDALHMMRRIARSLEEI